ncbi:hypothetical protein C0991_003829 [Blastosporella zonata]|nr:hypothetical protein C0991_003829 [Blastosporella zonata]
MATATLALTHAACDAALQALDDIIDDPNLYNTPLQILRTDFLSLLSLIYAATTKIALALKPSSPTYTAAKSPLKDLTVHITALSHCVRILDPTHGATFAHEFTFAAKDVIVSVKVLIQTFLDIGASSSIKSTGKAGDEYIVRTAAVHDVINNVRSSLSQDNVAAVKKKLAQNHASLDDGLQEVEAMVNDHDSPPDDDWEDDGWGELGIDSKSQMSPDELERTKKVHAILRLSTLLHKRIIKDVLTIPSGQVTLPPRVVQNLDLLPPQSSSLLVASDDLVATLYTPQVPSDISTELLPFMAVIDTLRSTLLEFIQEPSLVEQMQAMSLQTPQKDPKKWFQTCFAQIQKAADSLSSLLNTDA